MNVYVDVYCMLEEIVQPYVKSGYGCMIHVGFILNACGTLNRRVACACRLPQWAVELEPR